MCDLHVNFSSTWIPTNLDCVPLPYYLYWSAIYGYMVYILCIPIKYHVPSFTRVYYRVY